jgi:thiamine biosynthesis lipoprotein
MNIPIRRLIVFVLCLLLAVLVFQLNKGSGKRLFKETRTSLHTLVSITAVTSSEQQARAAMKEAYDELERLGRLLNFYADDSELTAINRNAGIKPVQVSPDTLEIVQAAVYAGEQTGGGFDVTVGPIVKLWDFNEHIIPDAASVAERLPFVGYQNIVVDAAASTVFLKKAGVRMDLGGIIKGFAADKAVAVLKRNGIEGGIVAVAGDIGSFGRQPDGRPWRMGVQNPRQAGDTDVLFATLMIEDEGISTSGDYQRYFIRDGVRYHHLLNPKTGFPESLCQSVTVIAPTATLTDPLATGIFIMGPQKGLAVLEKLGIAGIIVDRDGAVLMTSGLENRVRLIGHDRSDDK